MDIVDFAAGFSTITLSPIPELTGWVALLTLCAIINASGAIGDLWMVFIVLRYPKTVYVVDEKDGFRVFTRVTVCNDTLVA